MLAQCLRIRPYKDTPTFILDDLICDVQSLFALSNVVENFVTYSDICISLNQKIYKREPKKCEFIQPDDIVQVMLIHEPIMPIHQTEATSQKDL